MNNLNTMERARIRYAKFKQEELSAYNEKKNDFYRKHNTTRKFNKSPAFYSCNERYRQWHFKINEVESGEWWKEVSYGRKRRDMIRIGKKNMILNKYLIKEKINTLIK